MANQSENIFGRWRAVCETAVLGLTIMLTAGVPLLWAQWVIVTSPSALYAGLWDQRMLMLFGRTVMFSGLAAVGACLLAWPVAVAMGRGGGIIARGLWMIVPLPLLLPTMVMGYGWQQLLDLLAIHPMPQSAGDVLRCIMILATWLFPIPAVAMALALRRIDQSLLEQSAMDGVLFRFLAYRTMVPALMSVAICMVLAMQEFSIFESTGISVMATEIRMVFETGRLSSSQNPMMALVGGVGAADTSDLSGRSALALAAGMPVIVLTIGLAIAALFLFQKTRLDETIELAPPPPHLQCAKGWLGVAWIIVLMLIGLPVGAMVASLERTMNPVSIVQELAPQLKWSIVIAASSGLIGIGITCLAGMIQPRATLVVAMIGFLIGGQFTAIALLRLFSTSDVGVWLLDWNVPVVLAHVGRFAWIGLVVGAMLHAGQWRAYRQMAQVDGATSGQIFIKVIVGMGWPAIGLAGVLIGALSLTEVPATALLVPPSLVPMLLTWVHTQSYGPMIEASLMLCVIVLILGWTATLCTVVLRNRTHHHRSVDMGSQKR